MDRPNFIERAPQTIEAELIAQWETITGKPLFPAQAERLLINLLNYRETLMRVGIQYAAEQNLVNYAVADHLDQLGALTDTPRLPATAAQVTIRFTKVAAALNTSVLVPAGTRVATENSVVFATNTNVTIAAGQANGTVVATCTETGLLGNGFTANQINRLFEAIANIDTASNTTTSNGGTEIEDDERYRERIKLAPNKYSVAGPDGAYLYWTLTADANIIDAAVLSPRRVLVRVYPLTLAGLPSTEVLNKVTALFVGDDVRPLTDEVEVLAPTEAPYTITANITLLTTADAATLSAQLQTAAETYAAERRSKLGKDIIRSQIIAALSLPGVYSVSLTSPAADMVVAANEWANCTAITINVVGTNVG